MNTKEKEQAKRELMQFDPDKSVVQDVPSIDWLALKLSYLISQKNWLTARANYEASLDGWDMNYNNEHANINLEIEELMEKASVTNEGLDAPEGDS